MIIQDLISVIESEAPLSLQEAYDNAGLLIGDPQQTVTGALVCLDVTEAVIEESLNLGCNLIISHHPLIFKGLKKFTGRTEVERCVSTALKNELAVYTAHTNLDNTLKGVNAKIAEKLELTNCKILQPMENSLCKVVTFIPKLLVQKVRCAMFEAGAGTIGNYDSCSFNVEGYGSFRAGEGANPFVGELMNVHYEPEVRTEVIVPVNKLSTVLNALMDAHPYEKPAFDIIPLMNKWEQVGAGMIGELTKPVTAIDFMNSLKSVFNIPCIRHTQLCKKEIQKIAVCGGSGSFLINKAIQAGADVFVTADVKYHEFMEADQQIILVDAGHYETEQYTKELIGEIISKKFPTFALHISKVTTNPIQYL